MALGDELHSFALSILKLIQATDNVTEKKSLRRQLTAVLEETEVLISANIDEATSEYIDATNGLTAANNAINAALQDLAKVAETISKIAKAVDLLGKLAAKVGAF